MNTNKNTIKYLNLAGFITAAVLFGVVSLTLEMLSGDRDVALHPAASSSGSSIDCNDCQASMAEDHAGRAAKRLQTRLAASGNVPPLSTLEQSLSQRSDILSRSITVEARDPNHPDFPPATWSVSFAEHPELLTMRHTWASATFVLNEQLLKEYIDTGILTGTRARKNVIIRDTYRDGKKVERVSSGTVVHDGYDYETGDVAAAIQDALYRGDDTARVNLPYGSGSLRIATEDGVKNLELLATGISDFSNSPEERVWNVHKAIDERVNNVIVRPGQKYSFVDVLDAPVTIEKGWKEGMGLFGGGTADTPGAGICQAATTVYRAALLAGLPISYRRNHSMFVDHYEPYGIGLDATVFPGFHDLTFVNDTQDVIVIQSYTKGDDVFVKMYGTPDGRSVALDGPYFNITPKRPSLIRPLDFDEIGWVRSVTYASGKIEQKAIVSTYYKGFARSIKNKYAGTPGIELLKIKEPVATVAAADTSY